MLEHIVAILMVLSLILYALMGGADFGGGMWDFLATGPRATRQREAVAEAIGPIWEANHVWLILVIVLLFSGFPSGFAAMMTALNIPLTVMLIGIVLRGSAFMFRKYDSKSDTVQRRWSAVFGAASSFTPLFQGVIVGALATGQIRVVNGQVVTGFFTGWLTPFALGCGVFALGMFAFLAATYLTVDTKHHPDLQNDFRLRALWSGLILAPIAGVVFLASKQGAPEMFRGLTQWWAPLLLGCTSLFALAALLTLWLRRFVAARIAAVGQVTLILLGWGLAQYPNLITPDVTIDNTHAPELTRRLLVLALGAGAFVLLPSLAFLFHIFKGRKAV
jgi:cytochrome d ubiquinol oxidase subunit II